MKQKQAPSDSADESGTDEVGDDHQRDHNTHPFYTEEFAEEEVPPQRIKWLSGTNFGHMPKRVQIPLEKCTENWKESQAMHSHVLNKCRPLNPAVFDDKVMDNWRAWISNEELLWCRMDILYSLLSLFGGL